jgi:hypothetical protein
MESVPAGEKARSSTPPNESDEDDLKIALNLSPLSADIFGEEVNELSRSLAWPSRVVLSIV